MTEVEKEIIRSLVNYHKVAITYNETMESHVGLLQGMVKEGLLIPSEPNLIVTRKLKEIMNW